MSHEHPHELEHHSAKRKPFHHDWQFILAVVVMLAAIAAYVLSEDERIGGRQRAHGPMPALAPAGP
jgi:hypothetical protein